MADTPLKPGAAPTAAPAPEGQTSPASAVTPNPQMDQFARKERQIRKMQQELQKQKQDLESRAKSYETDYIPRSRLKEDLLGTLEAEGYDYNAVTERMLQQPQDPATKALMSKIKQLEDKQSAAERAAQENTQAQYQQALKQISNDAKMLVDSDVNFETVKSLGAEGIDAITELIEQTFQNEGILIDTVDAAKQIEDYLVEQGMKFAQFKKVQERLKPTAPPEAAEPPKVAYKPKTHTITTLTQQMQAQPAKSNDAKSRRERALAAFAGKLNN